MIHGRKKRRKDHKLPIVGKVLRMMHVRFGKVSITKRPDIY